jgi:hypothetical protein
MSEKLKNHFSEEQYKDGLLRMRVWVKLTGGDVKGAHKLAKLGLEKALEQEAKLGGIAPSWVKLSQALCAKDVQEYGAVAPSVGSVSKEAPTEKTWVEKALEVVGQRLKGVKNSLVSASMAIALLVGSTNLAVANNQPIDRQVTQQEQTMVVEDLYPGGKLRVEAQLPEGEVGAPKVDWGVESVSSQVGEYESGVDNSYWFESGDPDGKPSLRFSISGYEKDPVDGKINLKVMVENSSDSVKDPAKFMVADMSIDGAQSTMNGGTISYVYGPYKLPKDFPAHSVTEIQGKADADRKPRIELTTRDGESHSVNIDLEQIEQKLEQSQNLDYKSFAKFSVKNNNDVNMFVSWDGFPEDVKLMGLKSARAMGMSSTWTDESINDVNSMRYLLYPGQELHFEVASKNKEIPPLSFETIAPGDKVTKHLVNLSQPRNIGDMFKDFYGRATTAIFGPDEAKQKNWQEVKDSLTSWEIGNPGNYVKSIADIYGGRSTSTGAPSADFGERLKKFYNSHLKLLPSKLVTQTPRELASTMYEVSAFGFLETLLGKSPKDVVGVLTQQPSALLGGKDMTKLTPQEMTELRADINQLSSPEAFNEFLGKFIESTKLGEVNDPALEEVLNKSALDQAAEVAKSEGPAKVSKEAVDSLVTLESQDDSSQAPGFMKSIIKLLSKDPTFSPASMDYGVTNISGADEALREWGELDESISSEEKFNKTMKSRETSVTAPAVR